MNIVFEIVIGLFSAFLVNYIADTLPTQRRLSFPKCGQCGKTKDIKDYLLFSKCKNCSAREKLRNKLLYALLPILFILVGFFPLSGLGLILDAVILTYFSVVFIIDLENRLILNSTSIIGAIGMLIVGISTHGVRSTLIGGIGGYLIMLCLYLMGILFVGMLNKRTNQESIKEVALGDGDVNLSGILGFLLGWPGITGGLFVSIMLGGLFSGGFLLINILLKKYNRFSAIPYGPFLILGSLSLFYL